MKNPDCFKCKHFYITVDERFPRACKVFGVKGKSIPSIDVKRVTGHVCPVFTPKIERKEKSYIAEENSVDYLA